MAINMQITTLSDFETFINLPENADKLFEFIAGEIVEMPSNPYSSEISANIIFHIKLFMRDHNIAGHVTGEAGGYVVGEDRYAPDVAFISKDKQPELAREGFNPIPPDLAVEVISPTDNQTMLTHKVVNYLRAGTVVWVVDPTRQTVDVFQPNGDDLKLDNTATLTGGAILPGFELSVKNIFPVEE